MISKKFPIKSETACLLKWAWSTVYVYQGNTNSCHRTEFDYMPDEDFGMFHNSPLKVKARAKMLEGKWPGGGCEYCRDIELAGGMSDRMKELTMLDAEPNLSKLIPPELLENNQSLVATPTMVELYFSNKCNMSCIYCDPSLSSLWVAENRIHGDRGQLTVARADELTAGYDKRLSAFWAWFKDNYKTIKMLHVLGGEPFYQDETEQMIDFLLNSEVEPGTTIKFFSNLKVNHEKFTTLLHKMRRLVDEKKMNLGIVASLDSWGPDQEYVRTGLSLAQWEKNFTYMVNECPWLQICVNSTISSLSIKTMATLMEKINEWRKIHPEIINSFNLLTDPECMNPGIFPSGFFEEDLQRVINLMSTATNYDKALLVHLEGVKKAIENKPENPRMLKELKIFLNDMDRRKRTNWRVTFPWLVEVIDHLV